MSCNSQIDNIKIIMLMRKPISIDTIYLINICIRYISCHFVGGYSCVTFMHAVFINIGMPNILNLFMIFL